MDNSKIYRVKKKLNAMLTAQYNAEVPNTNRVNNIIKALNKVSRIDVAVNCVVTPLGIMPKSWMYGL